MTAWHSEVSKWLPAIFFNIRLFFFGGIMKANGVLLNYEVHKLNSTTTLVAWAFTLQCALAYILTPVGGYLLKYFNFRQLASVGGFLAGLGYICDGIFVTSVWHVFVFHSLSGIGFGLISLPSYLYLQVHFEDRFPAVISLSTSFIYNGVALLPLLMSFLTDQYGHSEGLLIFGALMWNCILCGVTLKPTPEGTKFLSSLAIRGEVISSSRLHFWDRYLFFFSSPFRHPKYAVCLTLAVASIYVYSSWAIFLVSFGESIGFSSLRSVYLSTFGGIGGVLGSWTAFLLFYYDKMNPFHGCFVPLVVNGACLLASVCTTTFYFTAFLMFISGFTQGFLYATLCGFIPVLLCKYHLQQGVAIAFTLQGVSYQLGGLISGAIKDWSGSIASVFIVNAVVCFVLAPLACVWGYDKRPVKSCYQ